MSYLSICIPAYKNATFLRRNLQALAEQKFTDFEVVVSDDSPTDELQTLVREFGRLKIRYHRNTPALGTPRNWLKAMEFASCEWIKLIHDDDWLARPDALAQFVAATQVHPEASIVFSAYNNVDLATGEVELVQAPQSSFEHFAEEPLSLFTGNLIGPPSTVFHRRGALHYDPQLKWVVDFAAYLQAARQGQHFAYLPLPLVNVGVSAEQVTKASFRITEVEVPENTYLLDQLGFAVLNNMWVFDYYWRLVRNLSLTKEQAEQYANSPATAAFLNWLIARQAKLSQKRLRSGWYSKPMMLLAYFACPFRKA